MLTDQAENLAGRRLQFERFTQFGVALFDLLQKPGVVDGDRRLVGERLQEAHFVIGESTRRRQTIGDGSDDFSVAPHRDREHAGRCTGS